MSVRRELWGEIDHGLDSLVDGQTERPAVEIWPEEDDFGRWVAGHNDPLRTVICNTPEYKGSPYCGRGLH